MDCKKCKSIYGLNCVCGGKYCISHLNNHNCTFNHLENHKRKLTEENPPILPEKLRKI